ncbi:MAG: methyltransferase domain-containing protein [Bryobacteraceae bacterium]|jgi:ubiquinone/menaquinone biosynthesis C-methylase UbiE/uncharacterized protein YbaR (Trm112 family)
MLRSLVSLLRCPVCLAQDQQPELHSFDHSPAGHVKDGVLVCRTCNSWYPIENELLELVTPALFYKRDYAAFTGRFSGALERLDLRPASTDRGGDVSAQSAQRRHFDWYADNADQTYDAYQKSPFWMAFDAATFGHWESQLKPGGTIVDVGCADGRSCFRLINRGSTVVGMDISKSLVRQAINRAARMNAQSSTSFLVGDASALPFRDNAVEYVVIYGVLHHLPKPGATFRETYRILKPGGVYFGSENNATIFRWIFDLLMKLRPIWREEAGEQALISKRHIEQWLEGLPATLACRSGVFVPPHLVNLLGHRCAGPALALTDRLFTAFPGLRDQGGLISFEVHKQ